MQPDLLQQLRDIVVPAEPSWWPPAPGWWLLMLVLLGLVFWLARELREAYRRRQPIKLARRYYEETYKAFQNGDIDATAYLHQTNELLKRLYIHGIGDDAARSAHDASWLEYLDSRSSSTSFTRGAGRQLGNQRFRPVPDADPESLHPVVTRLFKAARP
jgi:hypothetical protein